METIPHRQPFLLIDRIEELEPGKRAVGKKCVSYNEPFFNGHFPQEPVMPGVLILEALAQTGAVAILSQPENKGKTVYFGGIDKAKFKRKVVPGDVLTLELEIIKQKGPIGMGTAKATVDGKTYSHHIKVGFSPEKLRPYTTMPSDFKEFWEKAKAEQKEFPLTYTKEHVEKYSTDKIDCYLVKLQLNKRGQCVYGYLFYPKKEGKFPVVLCPPGAGIKTIKEPLRHKYYAEQGCIRFEFEIHGLNPEMSEEEFKEISNAFNGRENGYLTNGLDSRDNYYMKRVYLACVRGIDFLTSLPEWDGKNVIAQGGSQGGALALIAAGLDERVTACVANHPALSDMAGYKAGRAGGYPHFFRNSVDMDTPEKIKTMAYYDVVNFAKLIKADTYITWGFNDDTCPPTTSYIVYNVLNCPKEALITPINEHWTSNDTEYGHLLWIKKHLK